jgi:hypothetical protein
MHPHKRAPIAALPHRVPRQWHCHPNAVEVILHRPQEPPPPKPLSPRVRRGRVHRPARPLSYTLLTPVALRVPSAMHERDRPGVHGVLPLVQARNPTDAAFKNRPSSQPPRLRSVTRRGGRSSSSTLKVPNPQAGALPRLTLLPSMRKRDQSHPLARDDGAVNNDGHETGTKLVLFSVKIPFYQEDREDRDTAVPVTQCNELCIVTLYHTYPPRSNHQSS